MAPELKLGYYMLKLGYYMLKLGYYMPKLGYYMLKLGYYGLRSRARGYTSGLSPARASFTSTSASVKRTRQRLANALPSLYKESA